MTKKELLERVAVKLTSSKFWTFLAVFVVSVMAFLGADGNSQTQITAIIIAFGDMVVYVFGNVAQKAVLSDTAYDDESEVVDDENNQ